MRRYESWGRYPKAAHRQVLCVGSCKELPRLDRVGDIVLPYGRGRSYGDVCLNDGHTLIDASGMSQLLAFDSSRGIMRCEAGATVGEILAVTMPFGWVLPVVPGTRYVSVGGAIANDVHGKNHHRAGSFGCHLVRLELLRSDGSRLLCSPVENADWFSATIGGLGLTGLILWAEIQLTRVPGAAVVVERAPFGSLDEYFDLADASDESHEYTVAWIDGMARGRCRGRGVLFRGSHAEGGSPAAARPRARLPMEPRSALVGRRAVRALNWAYYHLLRGDRRPRHVSYQSFFFPLDTLGDWNRLYGPRGLLQYQCVVPRGDHTGVLRRILHHVAESEEVAALVTLKSFGEVRSPGLVSFARPGFALAVDLPYRGLGTLALLERLDAVVGAAGGAVNPAKDARMSAERFQAYYPRWHEFGRFVDPCFSSSFWRRVTGQSVAAGA